MDTYSNDQFQVYGVAFFVRFGIYLEEAPVSVHQRYQKSIHIINSANAHAKVGQGSAVAKEQTFEKVQEVCNIIEEVRGRS